MSVPRQGSQESILASFIIQRTAGQTQFAGEIGLGRAGLADQSVEEQLFAFADQVVEIGGNSAGFAVSETEGFFYVNYSTTAGESSLWRWDAAAVEAAIGEGRLTKAEGTLLCELTGGGYDTEVDAEGNIP